MQDIILVCKECGQKFIFSAEQQEFFAQRGITSKSSKCISCRKAKREAGRTQAMAEILHNPESHEVKCRLCGRVYVTMLKNVVHDVAQVCTLCAAKEFETIYPKEDLALNRGLGYPKYK